MVKLTSITGTSVEGIIYDIVKGRKVSSIPVPPADLIKEFQSSLPREWTARETENYGNFFFENRETKAGKILAHLESLDKIDEGSQN